MVLRADTSHAASLQICWCPLSFLQPSIVFAAAVTVAHIGEIQGTKGNMAREAKMLGYNMCRNGLQVTLLKQGNMRPKYFFLFLGQRKLLAVMICRDMCYEAEGRN